MVRDRLRLRVRDRVRVRVRASLVEEGVGHLDVVEQEDDRVNEDEGGGEVGAQLGDLVRGGG